MVLLSLKALHHNKNCCKFPIKNWVHLDTSTKTIIFITRWNPWAKRPLTFSSRVVPSSKGCLMRMANSLLRLAEVFWPIMVFKSTNDGKTVISLICCIMLYSQTEYNDHPRDPKIVTLKLWPLLTGGRYSEVVISWGFIVIVLVIFLHLA